jgi:hypothetical protein
MTAVFASTSPPLRVLLLGTGQMGSALARVVLAKPGLVIE